MKEMKRERKPTKAKVDRIGNPTRAAERAILSSYQRKLRRRAGTVGTVDDEVKLSSRMPALEELRKIPPRTRWSPIHPSDPHRSDAGNLGWHNNVRVVQDRQAATRLKVEIMKAGMK